VVVEATDLPGTDHLQKIYVFGATAAVLSTERAVQTSSSESVRTARTDALVLPSARYKRLDLAEGSSLPQHRHLSHVCGCVTSTVGKRGFESRRSRL
jgi:hypothetical protein